MELLHVNITLPLFPLPSREHIYLNHENFASVLHSRQGHITNGRGGGEEEHVASGNLTERN